jgi:hypothetical protein
VGVDGGGLEVNDELSAGEVPHLDAVVGSEHEPVVLGGEEHAVDCAVDFLLAEELALNEVPDHGEAVLATGGEVGGVGSHVQAVDLRLVADEGVLESHGLVVPDLDGLVPGGGDDDGGLHVLVEPHAGNPVGVGVLLDGELALADGVPDLEVSVDAAAGNLSVVGGEGDGEDVSRVANESLNGLSLSEVPESQGAVPGGSQAISAVLRESQIAHKVAVALEDLLGDAPLLVGVGLALLLNIPDHDGLVSGAGDEELLGLVSLGDLSDLHASNPTVVA